MSGIFVRSTDVKCQAGCGNTPVNVSNPTPEGYFSVSSPSACSVPDRGYVKTGSIVRLDTSAYVTGTCDIKGWDYYYGQCYFFYSTTRYLYWVDIGETSPASSFTNNRAWAPYASQSLDTRSGSAPTSPLNVSGQYQYTFQSYDMPDSCHFNTDTSPTLTKVLNVMQCQPAWYTDPGNTIDYHAPLGDIKIAIPTGFSAAQAPAEAAAADWGTALGRTINVVANSTCATDDPRCVTLSADFVSDDCGEFQGSSYDTDGQWIGPGKIRMWSTWAGAHPDLLRKYIAHELGHYFGLDNRLNSCSSADTVMGPSPTACYSATAPPTGTALGPSSSDIALLLDTVYNSTSHVRIACGW
jgi:hypothetical protein